jgi:acyl dehydratase
MAETTRWFDDFTPGETIPLGVHEMTREAIVAFARKYDPQPMHLDDVGGASSLLGALSASGWHTGCALMRLFVDALLSHTASLGSPGIETLKWLKPVHAGDRLTATLTVLEARASASRPRLGLVRGRFDVVNQNGVRVLMMESTLMVERRRPA